MGLEVLDNKIQVSENEIENYINISNLIIPFSIIFRKNNMPDIYSGEESVVFEERDSKYQQILLYEFLSD